MIYYIETRNGEYIDFTMNATCESHVRSSVRCFASPRQGRAPSRMAKGEASCNIRSMQDTCGAGSAGGSCAVGCISFCIVRVYPQDWVLKRALGEPSVEPSH